MPPKPPAFPKIIGHRGVAAHAPENTLAGLRKARELGCAMVEFDVKLSREGVPVLMHDTHVARTSGGAPGAVRDLGMAELAALDVGGWFHFDYVGERVPTLEEALRIALDLGLAVNIEIKPCGGREAETAERAIDVAKRVWPTDREPPLISSFSDEALMAAKAAAPDWPRGWLVAERPDHWREIIAQVDPATIHVDHVNQTRETVAEYKAQGHPVLVYTVNDPERAAQMLAMGVDALITDRPDALFALVKD
jgi:glycerophosphoryl diester phosphodiesterase